MTQRSQSVINNDNSGYCRDDYDFCDDHSNDEEVGEDGADVNSSGENIALMIMVLVMMMEVQKTMVTMSFSRRSLRREVSIIHLNYI